jgi:serine/threonine-protein kinase
MIGTVLAGRYEILEVLGQGGMGVVYKARRKDDNRPIAIKMLHEDLVANDQALKRFEQEELAVSRLNHPHILRVYEFGTTDKGRPFIAAELIEGASLEAVLKEMGRLPVGLAVTLFAQACSGLAHAHKQGVIHRDLKPSNLMLISHQGESTFVKIVDFGIAKLLFLDDAPHVDGAKPEQIIGSPLYMSPEQCRAENLDARSDIYSLGCVMYKAVTGVPPFQGKDLSDLLNKQINGLPASFQIACPHVKVPRKLESIIFRAMAKDRADRYQSMNELRRDLMLLGKKYAVDADAQLAVAAASYGGSGTVYGALSDPYEGPLDDVDQGLVTERRPLEDTTQISED